MIDCAVRQRLFSEEWYIRVEEEGREDSEEREKGVQ